MLSQSGAGRHLTPNASRILNLCGSGHQAPLEPSGAMREEHHEAAQALPPRAAATQMLMLANLDRLG
jgi:hypothetical protein